ncbi:MAG: helix-hairpin-helix domain-containing protein, partial [Bacteroidales bacterium]|nr:helix-hairpin-helix domain-containing protein [Bacteroidales bacterium]
VFDFMEKQKRSISVFRFGGVCIAFLLIGFQAAIFMHKATVLKIEQTRDRPDTVYVTSYYKVDEKGCPATESQFSTVTPVTSSPVTSSRLSSDSLSAQSTPSESSPHLLPSSQAPGHYSEAESNLQLSPNQPSPNQPSPNHLSPSQPFPNQPSPNQPSSKTPSYQQVRRSDASHSPVIQQVRASRKKVESFRFNPNTVSVEDLMRLGFSLKQAESIDRYRQKGGTFRRKSDFANSFVVADSVYDRLEKYIDIPLTDINKADSASLDALPGIGPFLAAKIIEYRNKLGGYSYKEQLMDIYRFDRQKYEGLSDLITCSRPKPLRLWSLPADSLRLHPYIRSWQAAKAIVLYRENTPAPQRRVSALGDETGILPDSLALKLARCYIDAAEGF